MLRSQTHARNYIDLKLCTIKNKSWTAHISSMTPPPILSIFETARPLSLACRHNNSGRSVGHPQFNYNNTSCHAMLPPPMQPCLMGFQYFSIACGQKRLRAHEDKQGRDGGGEEGVQKIIYYILYEHKFTSTH